MDRPEKLFPGAPEWKRRDFGYQVFIGTIAFDLLDGYPDETSDYRPRNFFSPKIDVLRAQLIALRDELIRVTKCETAPTGEGQGGEEL